MTLAPRRTVILAILVLLNSFVMSGCSREHEFESYGVYVKSGGEYKKVEQIKIQRDVVKAIQQINEVPFEENQIEFYVYTNDFDAYDYRLIQMDMFTGQKQALQVGVSPRKQENSYRLSATISDSNLPIIALIKGAKFAGNPSYLVSIRKVEDYVVSSGLKALRGDYRRDAKNIKELLSVYPENETLLAKKTQIEEEQQNRLNQAANEFYQQIVKLENENIKDERLLAHYREYLRKFASAEYAGEIREKYETLNAFLVKEKSDALAAEKATFGAMAKKFIDAVNNKNEKAIRDITVPSSIASKALRNRILQNTKIKVSEVTSYSVYGKQNENVQLQLDGRIYMIAGTLIDKQWKVINFKVR